MSPTTHKKISMQDFIEVIKSQNTHTKNTTSKKSKQPAKRFTNRVVQEIPKPKTKHNLGKDEAKHKKLLDKFIQINKAVPEELQKTVLNGKEVQQKAMITKQKRNLPKLTTSKGRRLGM